MSRMITLQGYDGRRRQSRIVPKKVRFSESSAYDGCGRASPPRQPWRHRHRTDRTYPHFDSPFVLGTASPSPGRTSGGFFTEPTDETGLILVPVANGQPGTGVDSTTARIRPTSASTPSGRPGSGLGRFGPAVARSLAVRPTAGRRSGWAASVQLGPNRYEARGT